MPNISIPTARRQVAAVGAEGHGIHSLVMSEQFEGTLQILVISRRCCVPGVLDEIRDALMAHPSWVGLFSDELRQVPTRLRLNNGPRILSPVHRPLSRLPSLTVG